MADQTANVSKQLKAFVQANINRRKRIAEAVRQSDIAEAFNVQNGLANEINALAAEDTITVGNQVFTKDEMLNELILIQGLRGAITAYQGTVDVRAYVDKLEQ